MPNHASGQPLPDWVAWDCCDQVHEDGTACTGAAQSDYGLCLTHLDVTQLVEVLATRPDEAPPSLDGRGARLSRDDLGRVLTAARSDDAPLRLGNVFLGRATIEGNASLAEATVEGDMFLNKTRVEGSLYLGSLRVEGQISLHRATIEGDVLLYRSTVEGGVSLGGTTVKGDVVLESASVKGAVFLTWTMVDGGERQRRGIPHLDDGRRRRSLSGVNGRRRRRVPARADDQRRS